MEKLKYIIIPNPFKDQEYAKYDYIGQFITNGTHTLADSAETIVQGRPHLDAAFVQYVVELLFEVIADEVADNYRCSIGGLSFALAISGSFPAANSPLSEDNKLYVAVTVGDPIRSTVAALVPEKDTEETVAVVINNVEDKASHEVGVIHGTATAIVTGRNLSATQTGESIVLADPDTLVTESVGTVVAQDGIGQRLEVNFAAPFEAGKYVLLLKTHGYSTPDAAVATYSRKVEATAAEVTKRVIKMTTLTANMMGETCTVETTGENFADVQNYSESGGYVTVPCKYSINGGADIDGGFMGSPSNPLSLNISSGVSAGDTIKVTLTPDPAKTDVDQNLVEKTAVAA